LNELFERILALKRVSFFSLLRTDELRHVAAALEPVGWAAGEHVFEKGDPVDAMYILTAGRVGICLDNSGSSPSFVAQLGPGECFGEMGILDDLPRSATVHVLENTEALALGRDRLLGMLAAYPELGIGMLHALSRRLREANEALVACRKTGGGAV
jgi:CRP-like cAMP-binding protein